jgi:peptide/nickel transport system permease protein
MDVRRFFARFLQRLGIWAAVLSACGLFAATLVRMAPGFGADERLLDPRFNAATQEAIGKERTAQRDVLRYYADYLARLARGDFGRSLSLDRPVRELLAERAGVTARSGALGLLWAWLLTLAGVAALEWQPRPVADAAASTVTGGLLCVPAAVAALLCVYAGTPPAAAIAVIVFPRVFRYARNVVGEARRAPHVLAAHALGIGRWRVLAFHVAAPVVPDLVALAGVSVSMAVGATIPVEALCDSPGVGHLLWQAALSRDVPVLVNLTLLITAVTAGANLLADTARAARENEA